ncbi:hypothetical protein [Streptomyces sp. NPDC054834]
MRLLNVGAAVGFQNGGLAGGLGGLRCDGHAALVARWKVRTARATSVARAMANIRRAWGGDIVTKVITRKLRGPAT